MKYLPLVMIIPLMRLIIADFRYREVSLVWLVVLAVGTIGIPFLLEGWREVITRSGLNMLLIAYLGTGIVLWGWIKSRKFVNPVNVYIGMGDILFFMILVPLFRLKSFAYLLIGSMVFSLVWWHISRWMKKSPEKTTKNIPLVATSGIVVCVTIIFNVLFE
ncbi:MAG: hypothetical protein LBR68_05940 [Lachnoclostridium sp.]|jgi:hypothetical protein|nr:hypothetical protein [Lachnoclostridium sp.]